MRVTNNPAISLAAGTAVTKNLLAKLNTSTGVADLCGATDIPIGQTMDTVDAAEMQGIRLMSAGTLELTASGAISKGVPVFTDASGKISATAADGARCVGISMDAATADGDIIGVLPSAVAASLIIQDLSASTLGSALATTGATNSSPYGFTTAAQADTLIALVNALRADLIAIRADLVASGLFLT